MDYDRPGICEANWDAAMGVFDPQLFEGVRRPLREAKTLPPECYTSPEFYAREIETIFMKKWNLIGRGDYVPNPGDYMVGSLVGVSFVVMRGADGEIRGFVNTCRHRGARLLDGEGSCERIVCPYHGWTYATDGRLEFANGMETAVDFDPTDYGLREIRLAIWSGFLFVSFDPTGPDIETYVGDLGDHLASYRLEDMVTVKREEFLVETNWKSYVENSMESFHHATVHKNSVYNPRIKKRNVIGDPGHYVLVQSDSGGETRALLPGDTGFPNIRTLKGPAARGSQYLLIYPATMIGCDVDSMWFKQMVPEGPDRVRNIIAICFPRETVERKDFDRVAPSYFSRFDIAIAEDNAIAEQQYQGLVSPFAQSGRFSEREPMVHAIDNWVLDQVLDSRKSEVS